MKIKIEYGYNPEYSRDGEPFKAFTYVGERYFPAFGRSYEDAKENLLDRLKGLLLPIPEVPPAEEVEL